MKIQIAALCLVALAAGSLQSPSFADDAWFSKWDHNHDGHWTYKEFQAANRDWAHRHHEKVLSARELRHQWDSWDTDHHGWVDAEKVREYHHWD